MADSLTPNFNFTLPEIGGSDDTWGNKLNANWTALDALIKSKFDTLATLITTRQLFNTAGAFTWTKPTGCRFIQLWGSGAGAAGGGAYGIGAGYVSVGGGGSSGICGHSDFIDVRTVTNATGIIGAKGIGVAAGNGGNGGETKITIDGVDYIFAGGSGGLTSGGSYSAQVVLGAGGGPTSGTVNVTASAWNGHVGIASFGSNCGASGAGGSSWYGVGAPSIVFGGLPTSQNGASAHSLSRGAGGGGALVIAGTPHCKGGDGSDGVLEILEFY